MALPEAHPPTQAIAANVAGAGPTRVYSIGFTRTTAEHFFNRLKSNGIQRLLDVRLNNTSQLAGWARQADLPFFLRTVANAEYVHEPLLAPTSEILDAYKKHGGDWQVYVEGFNKLLHERHIETAVPRALLTDKPTVLLCSEHTADQCHRRLVLEYLQDRWGGLEIVHL